MTAIGGAIALWNWATSTPTQVNEVEKWKRKWLSEVVPACVDLFLTMELTKEDSSAPYGQAINRFADHPTYGFLKPGKKDSENPSDYVGFINEKQFSQINVKINSLHSGTGTAKSKAVVSKFNSLHSGEGKGAFYVAAGIHHDISAYAPLHGQGADVVGGQTSLNKNDLIYGMNLFATAGQFNYGGALFGGATRGWYLGNAGSSRWRAVIVAQPTPEQGEFNEKNWSSPDLGMFSSANLPWDKYLSTVAAARAGTGKPAQTAAITKNDTPLKQWFGPQDTVFNVDRRGYAGDRNWMAFAKKFISRIARNFPDLIAQRVHAIVDEILKDIVGDTDPDALVESPDAARPLVSQDPVKEGPDAVSRYGGFLKPFDLQCFLMENISYIADIKDNDTTGYEYLGKVTDNRENPGNLVSTIQHGQKTEQIRTLLALCPDAYALLTPLIRIYRVDYKGDDYLEPYKETEIPFPSFINPADLDILGTGRVPGAGIKSFSWSLDGINPAEVDNNISANLTLYFQSIQDLFALNKKDNGDYDLKAGREEAGYLDLIIGSGARASKSHQSVKEKIPKNANLCDVLHEEYEGARFRIKVVVGWSPPPDDAVIVAATGMNGDQAAAFRSAIADTQTALYLQVTRHQLNFKDDATVELSIDYQAALSGIMRGKKADIFEGETNFSDHRKAAEEDEKEARKALKKEEEGGGGADDPGVKIAATKSEKAADKAGELRKKDKMEKYRIFLDILYKSDKIYNIKINADTYKDGLISKEPDPAKRAQMAKTRKSSDEATRGFGEPLQTDSVDDSILKDLANFSSTDGNTPKNALEGADEFEQYASIQLKKDNAGSINVPYFYLGDLLDGILHHLQHIVVEKNGSNGSLQLLLGAIEVMDPLLGFQIKNVDIECKGGERTKQVVRAIAEVDPMRFAGSSISDILFSTNIGSIPISLTYFQEWYVTHVIRPQREGYTLLSFLKDISAGLIGKAFNSICFENTLQYRLKFDITTFNLANSYRGSSGTSVKKIAESKKLADERSRKKLEPSKANVIPSIIFYSPDSRPRTGDYETDLANGIYHYYLGSACGLNKTIKFNRMDMPYYREARMSKRGNLSATQLRELYTVSMDMVGNTLHKNGQYLYIEPIGVGIGDRKAKGTTPNLARILGIGGYHLVSKVAHTISDAGFNVTVEALQEGLSMSENKITSLNLYEDEDAISPSDNPNEEKPKTAEEKRWEQEFGSETDPDEGRTAAGGSGVKPADKL
tara:strand:+ start:11292 stop:15020 length:3729 start_codon:yes stop_codon:yes gene_type:complete